MVGGFQCGRVTALNRLIKLAVGAPLGLALSLEPPLTQAAGAIPDVSFRVAYRQLSNGELSESVHQVQILCSQGSCTLTTLTLNQCWQLPEGEPAMVPRIERASTDEQTLTVTARDGVLTAEEKTPETILTYRFEYDRKEKNLMFTKLTGFSGVVVKDSDVLKKIVSWEMVPLKGQAPRIKAACEIMLDGIPE
jgi:hypothetical protein